MGRGRDADRGFTLIELLVVVAILSLLITLLVPSLKTAKELAVQVRCKCHMRAYCDALQFYVADSDGRFPYHAPNWYRPSSQLNGALGEYVNASAEDLQCSAALKAPYQIWPIGNGPTCGVNRTIIGYILPGFKVERLAKRASDVTKHEETWLFCDGNYRGVFHTYHMDPHTEGRFFWYTHFDGANVGYLDAHVGWVSINEWTPPRIDPGNGWCAIQAWHTMWE